MNDAPNWPNMPPDTFRLLPDKFAPSFVKMLTTAERAMLP